MSKTVSFLFELWLDQCSFGNPKKIALNLGLKISDEIAASLQFAN